MTAALLRGASASALAELSEKAAATHVLANAAAIGEELFGVAALLDREPTLRRVLADASVEGSAKAALATSVFGASLREDSLAILTDAVEHRWTAPRDLVVAFDELAAVSVVRSAGAQGRSVSDELFAVRQLIVANPQLRAALADASRSSEDRTALLHGLLEGNAQEATLRLVDRSIAVMGNLDSALERYQDVAAGVQGAVVAVVRSARELTENDQTRLTEALGKQYDATVHLHVVVDPTLVGGLRVEIGDDVIDGTVVNRLDDARRRLVG